MVREDKNLLVKELCVRLPYGLHLVSNRADGGVLSSVEICGDCNARITITCHGALSAKNVTFPLHSIADHLPYLRPMSSMTEEEKKELEDICVINYNEFEGGSTLFDEMGFDWLNAHHFDYRGLIARGLAIEAPSGMYWFK